METTIHQKLTEKIKNLPEFLVEEISDYIDFLVYKNQKDWVELLDEKQKQEIQKGLKDIEEGRVFSHDSVMEEMAEYIQSKKK